MSDSTTEPNEETFKEKIARIRAEQAVQIAKIRLLKDEMKKHYRLLKDEMKRIKDEGKAAKSHSATKIVNQKKERILKMASDGLQVKGVKESEIERVHRRIPKWAQSPNQTNHKILKNYLKLLKQNDFVLIDDLENQSRTIKSFKSNFGMMKIISDHNHAKVFHVIDDRVYLWEPVKNCILKEFQNIL
jgi:hypothetical protein